MTDIEISLDKFCHLVPGFGVALTLYCLLVLSGDNFCKQFGPRSGLTKHRACSGPKLFDTNGIQKKNLGKKMILKKNQQTTITQ